MWDHVGPLVVNVGGSFGCVSEIAYEPLECEGLPYTEKLLLKDTSKMYITTSFNGTPLLCPI